jgi:hypothetical protein
MSKNPSDRKTMPGQGEGSQDWKKDKEHKGSQGQHGQQGQQGQQTHRQGEPMGQQPKPTDPSKQRQGGTDTEETDERKRRPA